MGASLTTSGFQHERPPLPSVNNVLHHGRRHLPENSQCLCASPEKSEDHPKDVVRSAPTHYSENDPAKRGQIMQRPLLYVLKVNEVLYAGGAVERGRTAIADLG